MESPSGTTQQEIEIPQTVEGQLAEDLELVIAGVRGMVQGNTGQREWAIARTHLETAAHWVSEARGMNGGRGIAPGWFPEREVEVSS